MQGNQSANVFDRQSFMLYGNRFYYQDNSKFPDTIVHYTKHAGVIVHREYWKHAQLSFIEILSLLR